MSEQAIVTRSTPLRRACNCYRSSSSSSSNNNNNNWATDNDAIAAPSAAVVPYNVSSSM